MRAAAQSNLTRIEAGVTLCFDRLSNPVTDVETTTCVDASNVKVIPVDITALSVKPPMMPGPTGADAPRADWVANAYPGDGYWGDYLPWTMCPPGQYAYGYEMLVEADSGSTKVDDTAVDWLRMFCGNFDRTVRTTIEPPHAERYGLWGSWRGQKSCSIGPMHGMTIWIEVPQGDGDDTAADDLSATCVSGESIQAPGGIRWPSARPSTDTCPGGTAICGFLIRVEPPQGRGDDTGMNGIRLACCAL
ncbi:hypothetical protein [Sorangium cellulosum]|nr:hypothetical protein [Sorangium cellulosum]